MIVILANFESKEDAVRVSRKLLEKQLIAGYSMWPVEAAFWWKGKIMDASECTVMMKSTVRWFDEIADFIRKESGYEIPDLFAIDSEKIEPDAQHWLNDNTR